MDTRVAVTEYPASRGTTVHCRQDGHPVSTEGDQHYQYCH